MHLWCYVATKTCLNSLMTPPLPQALKHSPTHCLSQANKEAPCPYALPCPLIMILCIYEAFMAVTLNPLATPSKPKLFVKTSCTAGHHCNSPYGWITYTCTLNSSSAERRVGQECRAASSPMCV